MTDGPATAPQSSLNRRFFALAVPMVLANITVPLAGLVDVAMLGHLDTATHLAGVALGSIVFDYLFWTFGFLRMATTGLTAQAQGREQPVEAIRVGLRAIGMGAAIGCVLVLLGPAIAGVAFGLLEGATDALDSGRLYFDARLLGAPAALTNFAITGWLLGQERSRSVLAIATLSNVLNIVLDWVFIFEWGWASAGAGYATALAQYAGLALGLVLVWRGALSERWQEAVEGLWQAAQIKALMALNLDITVRTLALVSAFAVFTDFSAMMGTSVLAANALMLKVVGLAAWFIDGFAFAVESLVGRFHGAGDRVQAKRLLQLALGWALAVGLGIAAVFVAFPEALFGVLTNQPDLIARVSADAPVLFGMLGFGSIAYILDGWFLGISAGPTMRNAMLVSLAVGFVPLVLWARVQQSPDLLWAALVLFMAVRVLTLGSRVRL